MADYLIKGETLTGIADAIRRKTGSTEDIKAKDMESNIDSISTGTDTSDATVTADEIFAGEVAYGPDGKVTGTFTIDDELTEQDNLISQITTLVNQKATPQGGIIPAGTFNITANGIYDITNYASVNVDVSNGGGSTDTVYKTCTINIQFDQTYIDTYSSPDLQLCVLGCYVLDGEEKILFNNPIIPDPIDSVVCIENVICNDSAIWIETIPKDIEYVSSEELGDSIVTGMVNGYIFIACLNSSYADSTITIKIYADV